jgi:hypothetical protein
MSTIKGPFDFNGSFGNFRYYYDPVLGKHILSQKGGPTREQFKNHSNYKRARENSNEFGGQSKFASQLKKSLSDIGHLMYPRCFNQIVSTSKLIQQLDEDGDIGYRAVVVHNAPSMLTGIDFNKRYPFRNVFRGSYETNFSLDKTTVTLSIPGFIPARQAHWVTNFNAVRIYLAIAQISDMGWNAVIKDYDPVVNDLEVLSQYAVSDWMVRNSVPVDINLTASFEEPALTSQGTSVVVAMGIEFSTSVFLGQPYVTPQSGSMAIVECYTQ